MNTQIKKDNLTWWREARFGMFIHWGLYSILAGEWQGQRTKSLGEWIQCHMKIPFSEYKKLAEKFNPLEFDADFIAKLAADAGMRYLTITAKHHDGFAMYHSKVDSYNIIDATPFGRDPVEELAIACKKYGITFCIYYSQDLDWAHPDGGGNTWDYDPEKKNFTRYFEEKSLPQVKELLTNYGPIGLVWFDMAQNISREQSMQLRDLVHSVQPGCLVSGRVGHGVGDYGSLGDNQLPLGTPKGDWETPATLNNSWGFKSFDHSWRNPDDIIGAVVDTAEKGVNYLLNIGPDALGRVPQPSVDILRAVAVWMHNHGEAIHSTSPNPYNCEFNWGRVTAKGNSLYLFFKDWPGNEFTLPGLLSTVKEAILLECNTAVAFNQESVGGVPVLKLTLPSEPPAKPISVLKLSCTASPEVVDGCCQQTDGSLMLPPHLAIPNLNSKPSERKAGKINEFLAASETAEENNEVNSGLCMGPGPSGVIENWFSTDDYLTWECNILQPGVYNLTVQTMARKYQPWLGGHLVEVEIDGQVLSGEIKDDGRMNALRNYHFEEAQTLLGTLEIEKAGHHQLALIATEIRPDAELGLSLSCVKLQK